MTSTSYECPTYKVKMNDLAAVLMHVKGKNHAKQTRKFTELKEVPAETRKIRDDTKLFEQLTLADLPTAGQAEKISVSLKNNSMDRDINNPELWESLEKLKINKDAKPTIADWKERNKTLLGYRIALYTAPARKLFG